ncbi:hypothetical protein CDIK_3164 [Cucumispora dikerogammari]|nr:hypothetical protein CDIK_3164 [Cucumispora dikerogammari]
MYETLQQQQSKGKHVFDKKLREKTNQHDVVLAFYKTTSFVSSIITKCVTCFNFVCWLEEFFGLVNKFVIKLRVKKHLHIIELLKTNLFEQELKTVIQNRNNTAEILQLDLTVCLRNITYSLYTY